MITVIAVGMMVIPLLVLVVVYHRRLQKSDRYIDLLLHSEDFWRCEVAKHREEHDDERYRPHSDRILK